MKKLTQAQTNQIKDLFEKSPEVKYGALQGNIFALMKCSHLIGLGADYSVIQRNLHLFL